MREGLLIDAEVERPEDPDFVPKVYEIEMADITMEKVEAFLAERGEAVETVNTDITTEDGHRVFLANTDKGSYVQYTSDQNELYMGNSVYYISEADRWYSSEYVFLWVDSEEWNANSWKEQSDDSAEFTASCVRYLEPKEFSFATAEEAEAEARQALQSLGIRDLILSETYYQDHETMALVEAETLAMVEELNAEGTIVGKPDDNGGQDLYTPKESWTEADDCYTFVYQGGADGLPMTRDGIFRETVFYSPTRVLVRVGASGIVRLQASQAWNLKAVAETPERIIPAAEALEVVKEKISGVIMTEDRVVSRVSLRYQYMQDRDRWVLRPVWEVTAIRMDVMGYGFPYDEYSYTLVDAVTGKEI